MGSDDKTARVHLDGVQELRFTAHFPDLSHPAPIDVDEEPPLGGGAGPNPASLLAAAVGSCLASSLAFCLKKARATPRNISADVSAHIARNETGRYRVDGIDVELAIEVADTEGAGLARCESLFEDFCIVTESVRRGIPVNVRLTTLSSEPVATGEQSKA